MTDDFLTLEQVASSLGVSTRTVRSYAKKGLLARQKQRGDSRIYFLAADVAALKDVLTNGEGRLVVAAQVLHLQVRVHELEARMSVVLQVLAENIEPVRAASLESRVRQLLKRAI